MKLHQLFNCLGIYTKKSIPAVIKSENIAEINLQNQAIILRFNNNQQLKLNQNDLNKKIDLKKFQRCFDLDYQALQLYNQATEKFFVDHDLNSVSNFLSKKLGCVIYLINYDHSVLTSTNRSIQDQILNHQTVKKLLKQIRNIPSNGQEHVFKLINHHFINVYWINNKYQKIGQLISINQNTTDQFLINIVLSYFADFTKIISSSKEPASKTNNMTYSKSLELALVDQTTNHITYRPDLLTYLRQKAELTFFSFGFQRKVNEIFLNNLIASISKIFPTGLYCYLGNNIILLTGLKPLNFNQPKLLKSLQKIADNNNISIGISNPFSSITDLFSSYHQANLAMAFNSHTSAVIKFNEIAPYYISALLKNHHRLSLIDPQIANLKSYDLHHHTDYYRTSLNYLLLGFNVSQTAKALHVHHNTVLYRIKQIKKILAYDFKDPRKNSSLFISLILSQYL